MCKNADQRMIVLIKALLLRQNFNVFSAETNDQSSDLIIRNILENRTPQYIEICLLSRTEEYNIEIKVPIIVSENHFYYYILYSPGMNKIWLFRHDELIALRKIGLDERDTSPYLIKDFSRLLIPELRLEEFKKL